MTRKDDAFNLPEQCRTEIAALPSFPTRWGAVREINGALGEHIGVRGRYLRRFNASGQEHITSIAQEIQAACDDYLTADAKRRA